MKALQELETEVVERERRAVGELIEPHAVMKPLDGRDVVGLEGIAAVAEVCGLPGIAAEPPEIRNRNLRPEAAEHLERNAREVAAAKECEIFRSEFGIVFRDVKTTVPCEAFKGDVCEGLAVCGAARRDVKHIERSPFGGPDFSGGASPPSR